MANVSSSLSHGARDSPRRCTGPKPWILRPTASIPAAVMVCLAISIHSIVVFQSKMNVSQQGASNSTSPCCYSTSLDTLDEKFTREFFVAERKKVLPVFEWSGREEEEWSTILSKFNETYNMSYSCKAQWKYTVMNAIHGFYLRTEMDKLLQNGVEHENESFRYIPSSPGLPRILVLGDSVSRGIWVEIQNKVRSDDLPLSVQGAPTNCGGFPYYKKYLSLWLGDCPWDLVQFNVGMHFHGTNTTEYEHELARVVEGIREHSPKARVVFATTTPSPFDSNKTWPNITTCKNYHKFHGEGFIPKLNAAASASLSALNVTINDRYSAIIQDLDVYQQPCDIHFHRKGYEHLAEQDLEVFSTLLGV